ARSARGHPGPGAGHPPGDGPLGRVFRRVLADPCRRHRGHPDEVRPAVIAPDPAGETRPGFLRPGSASNKSVKLARPSTATSTRRMADDHGDIVLELTIW